MNTACILDSASRLNGGIFEAERHLQQSLVAGGVRVAVLAAEDEFTEADLPLWDPLRPQIFPVTGPRSFGRCPKMALALEAGNFDLVYSTAIWKQTSILASRWARDCRKPHVIAPHGMLDEWALKSGRWRKRVATLLYQRNVLRRAVCVRALCQPEVSAIRAYGIKSPVCLIPNGVDLPATPPELPAPWSKADDGRRSLLFLGRIHPKKGLANLISAWAATRQSDWLLVIAGWDQGGHEATLRQMVAELGVSASVRFLGPRFGKDRDACYQHASAFILPSFSEGLPMSVLEAWAWGKPVLMTPECNLPEGFQREAAIRIETHPAGLAQGLRALFDMSASEQTEMGRRGRALVAERFTWPKVAAEMRSVYEWVLGGGAPPACVVLN
jgi:poly(glycerol-phosphate) alpha-glucosyltransferase